MRTQYLPVVVHWKLVRVYIKRPTKPSGKIKGNNYVFITVQFTSEPTCLFASSLASLLIYLLTYVLIYLLTYQLTYLLACLLVYLSM